MFNTHFMQKKVGFTLIELLIVVAIIAILAAIAIPNFLAAQVRAKVSRTKEDMRSVAIALEAYRIDNNYYPMDVYDRFYEGGDIVPWATNIQNFVPLTTPVAYISSVPKDIFPFETYEGAPVPYDNQYYNYQCFQPWFNGDYSFSDGYGPNGFHSPDGPTYIWTIISWGPTITEALPSTAYYPITSSYDPTNGTVSWGNIIRYGP